MHAAGAREAGLTDDMLEAIARGDTGFFDALASDGAGATAGGVSYDEAAAVRRVALELVAERALSQNTWEAACDVLGVRGVVDLVVLVGYYDLMALMLAAFRVPLPEGAQAADSGAAASGAGPEA